MKLDDVRATALVVAEDGLTAYLSSAGGIFACPSEEGRAWSEPLALRRARLSFDRGTGAAGPIDVLASESATYVSWIDYDRTRRDLVGLFRGVGNALGSTADLMVGKLANDSRDRPRFDDTTRLTEDGSTIASQRLLGLDGQPYVFWAGGNEADARGDESVPEPSLHYQRLK